MSQSDFPVYFECMSKRDSHPGIRSEHIKAEIVAFFYAPRGVDNMWILRGMWL